MGLRSIVGATSVEAAIGDQSLDAPVKGNASNLSESHVQSSAGTP